MKEKIRELVTATLIIGAKRASSDFQTTEQIEPIIKQHIDGMTERFMQIFQGAGIGLIAEERHRQIEKEGWTTEHDDEHDGGELAMAAVAFAAHPAKVYTKEDFAERFDFRRVLPFGEKGHFKKDELRNLVIAGALIAAEIDRIKRLKEEAVKCEGCEKDVPLSQARMDDEDANWWCPECVGAK